MDLANIAQKNGSLDKGHSLQLITDSDDNILVHCQMIQDPEYEI